jgi:AraC-like DNA-binding protein
MKSTVIYIQNMVCDRCISAVKKIAEDMSLTVMSINLGSMVLDARLSEVQMHKLEMVLEEQGFKLLKDRKHELVEAIKNHIVEYIETENYNKRNLSHYISSKLKYEYNYLTGIFSQLEGITIERYYILLKIEKVKELMFMPDLRFAEIAYRLGYSSPQHLSTQFKQVTGLTPSKFRKKNTVSSRRQLDNLKII